MNRCILPALILLTAVTSYNMGQGDSPPACDVGPAAETTRHEPSQFMSLTFPDVSPIGRYQIASDHGSVHLVDTQTGALFAYGTGSWAKIADGPDDSESRPKKLTAIVFP